MNEIIYQELKKRCKELGIVENKVFSANHIANTLQISRNSVSQHLNEYVKQGKVVKINTRPVYFYIRKEVETYFNQHINTVVYDSYASLMKLAKNQKCNFEKLIGYENSLRNVVEQSKAAISYPDYGLPLLIHGPTGTGKSMIASLLYEFAVDTNLIAQDKSFVAVNCSEFANNPELLTANLFGHVKGAYTGADEDNSGLISVADGGLLFLDEVHCLPAECQEKLFFFMDKGMYRQLGDNEHWLHSRCRLVFATTENPQDVLLKTLLRRIPIIVDIPSLKDRPLLEKKSLIYTVFEEESLRLCKNILLSNVVYQMLMDFEFSGNVGAMKNAIKASCARAFLNKTDKKDDLEIHIHDLPDYILNTFPTMQLKGSNDVNDTMIPLDRLNGPPTYPNMLLQFYERLMKRYLSHVNSNESFAQLSKDMKEIIQNYTDYLIYKNRYRKQVSEDYLHKILDKIYSIVMNKYSLSVPNNEIHIYANVLNEYTKHVIDTKMWISSKKEEMEGLVSLLENNVPREVIIAKEIVDNAALNLDLELDDVMLAILTFAFISYEKNTTPSTIAVILCHGYSTASSIAAATNRMIGEYIFDGIDMELSVNVDKIVNQLEEYLKQKTGFNELILLVDMGSLEEIYQRMKPIANCNIGIMNNVTTKLALEVGMGIKHGSEIATILKDIQSNFAIATQFIEGKGKKSIILTICATGFGAAKKISELLIESMPTKVPIEIIPYEYQTLLENGSNDRIFERYHVELIVGTLDPKIAGYTFIPVENLVMNDGVEALDAMVSFFLSSDEIEKFRENMMKNFTLSNIVNHLTILNAEKVIDDVEDVVDFLQMELNIKLDVTRKAGLYVHLSCLIERLILKNEIVRFDGMEQQIKEQPVFLDAAHRALSGVEERYSVEVPEAELIFIYNYFENI